MRSLLLTALLTLFVLTSNAQDSSITMSIDLYAQRFDGKAYLVLALKTKEERRLLSMSTMKFKLSNGEVLKFDGFYETAKSSSSSFGTYGTYMSTSFTSTSTCEYVRFDITEEQIEKLKEGVVKVSINTIPKIFTKEFKTDKIGSELYEAFSNMKDDF